MRRRVTAGLAGATAALLAASAVAVPAYGAPAPAPASVDREPQGAAHRADNLPDPFADQEREVRKQAIADLISGKAKLQTRNGSKVIQVKADRFVEYQQPAKVDPIFSILVEFGNQKDPRTGGTDGPLHNQIPPRDRVYDGSATDDNSTIWRSDFSRQSYMDLFYSTKKESMRDFYLKQSGGRYTVGGDVSDWVSVPFNEARYGSNEIAERDGYWAFVKDTATAWYESQVAAGKSNAEIQTYLKQFDIWDRSDYDNDGDFNEPDGYIDHFQAVHAGEGEEAGGGAQGADAIWSHRWSAFTDLAGSAGPDFNKHGGVQIGDSGIWIRDYTTEPENGGLGVFAHEYGHDLGLPDLYDTQGGDNGVGFWSAMASGSWLNHGKEDIGSTPGYFDPWSKLYMGWLNYSSVDYDSGTTYATLGAAGDTDGLAQAVVVNLPDQEVSTELNTPFAGQYEWWSGSADDLTSTLARPLDLTGATTASINAKAWYNIEEDFDYLYAEVSTNGGSTWTPLDHPLIDEPEVGGTPEKGIDGSTEGEWIDLNYDLAAYVGQTVQFRYRYASDAGTNFEGAFLDNVSLVKNGAAVWTDGAETVDPGWTADGFTRFTGKIVEEVPQFYIAEYRTYYGYDKTLETGPYNFGWTSTRPDFVERFKNHQGLLVWYVNYAYDDNDTIDHPGFGLNLPVDVRPGPITVPGVGNITNRRGGYDATFSRFTKPAQTFHLNGVPTTVPKLNPVTVFNDSQADRYWSAQNPMNSVKVAGTGTKIELLLENRLISDLAIIKVTN
ncbi:immune inhibitor A domain-containing protein [Plantactinospora soyae]|uniref:Immune inhibitor A n=1 Tax=Plantactinospora soyae TaxID=1544732 RepID=A0A927QXM1_9ACTN|nr:immune inhibitor A domain-containing protein [Plantactinospora soyae]MBE1485623.1 immune inhibitor A [Plantactinospora soyae]